MFKLLGFMCVMLVVATVAYAQGPWIMEWYALDPIRGTAGIEDGRKTDWLAKIFGKDEASFAAKAPDPALKSKWTLKGEPDGSIAFKDNKFTIKAAGADIWGTADAFRFSYKEMKGDFEIALKADSLTKGVNDWSKIGPMVRQNNKPGSQYIFMLARAKDGNKYFQERMTEGGSATGNGGSITDAAEFPVWLKITRKGNDFKGAVSKDGKTWADAGLKTTTLAFKDPVLVGLAVTSHKTGTLVDGVASEVTIDGKALTAADVAAMKSEDIGTVKTETYDVGWAVRNLKKTADDRNLSNGVYEGKYGDMSNYVFYGIVGVISPKAQDTVLNLAQDDDAIVWLNGKKVIESVGWTGGAEKTKPFDVKLNKGMNAMMVKVSEGGGGDYLNARFNATDLTFTPSGGKFDHETSVSPGGKLSATWGDIKAR